MDSGVLFHTLYATITNSQRQKERMLIVVHFELILQLRSFVSGIVQKRALNQNKNTNTVYCLQNCWKLSLLPKFWGPRNRGP